MSFISTLKQKTALNLTLLKCISLILMVDGFLIYSEGILSKIFHLGIAPEIFLPGLFVVTGGILILGAAYDNS